MFFAIPHPPERNSIMKAWFDPGLEGFAGAEIDWDAAVFRAVFLRGYTFNAAHKFLSEIPR
ncbi:MAG: hypothetical protein WKF96_08120 [Solirubrobacteraceae bacterium]